MENMKELVLKAMDTAEAITMFCNMIEGAFIYLLVRFAFKMGVRAGKKEKEGEQE
jgi:hypothetical protein